MGANGTRTSLGLGLVETAVMTALWESSSAMTINEICGALVYHKRLQPQTIHTVTCALRRKGLADREKRVRIWHFRPALSRDEYVGKLIAHLLSQAHDPQVALEYARCLTV